MKNKERTVAKVGGSTLLNADSYRTMAQILRENRYLAVAVSARGGDSGRLKDTDRLFAEAAGNHDKTHTTVEDEPIALASELGLDTLDLWIRESFSEGRAQARHNYPDPFVRVGDCVSARIIAELAYATYIDPLELVSIDHAAKVLIPSQNRDTRTLTVKRSFMNGMVVTAGFSGRRADGSVGVLPRDGTTTTALVLADYVKATRLDNWSDVPGIYAVDPRFTPGARIVPEVTAAELWPLCFRKTLKVLDMNSVRLARALGVTIRVCSPNSPENPGTYVRPEACLTPPHGLTGIGVREQVTVLTLNGERLPYEAGIGQAFIGLCAEGESDVDFVGIGDSISVIVFRTMTEDEIEHIRAACKEQFRAHLDVHILTQVLLVGAYMRDRVGVMARIAGALSQAGINILTDGQTHAQTHVSITVAPEDAHHAVSVLYREFFTEDCT